MRITIDNLTMAYGEHLAIRDLSLTVDEGEMLVLLGPSGSGKTSTMRCIAGLEAPIQGRISIGELTVYDSLERVNVPANKRRIGMVFQSYAIWPHRSVYQNVAFPLQIRRLPSAEVRSQTLEALELVGMSAFADRGASLLSGGQMQRVALARSIAMKPRVLLLDEPLSNLDAKLRDKLRFELRELQQALSITTLYVTHDQSEALAIADRIAVMSGGEIVQLGSPTDIYRSPSSSFVADFLGVSNLFQLEETGLRASGYVKLAEWDITMVVATGSDDGGNAFDIAIRPEDVFFVPEMTSEPNLWLGTIIVGSFLGSHARYRVQIVDGPVLEAVIFGVDEVLRSGAEVIVHIPPERVSVVPRDPS